MRLDPPSAINVGVMLGPLLVGLSGLLGPVMAVTASSPPNFVLIVADDLGYSDLGCFGGEIETPNLDQLAADGHRLTRMYNGGMCVVTRLSLMTGRWWPAATRTFDDCETLPERLRGAGYQTALIGKWHLPGHPMDHGLDHFYGFLGGFADHFAGSPDYRLDREPFTEFGPDHYSTDAMTDRAIDFVRRQDGPFFLNLCYQAPHNPLQAPADDIAKYRGRYREGWRVIRERRVDRQRELGLIAADADLPPYPQNLPDWQSLTDAQRDLEDLRMATYAAMVDRLDRGVGRLMAAMRQTGVDENTIVIFISDNGMDSFSVADRAMLAQGKLPGDRRSNYQPGTGWAYVGATPWRLYKISQHAGGVATGAIWRPADHKKASGRIKDSVSAKDPSDMIESGGAIVDRPLHVIDILPTVLDACGMSRPVDVAGRSFRPLVSGKISTMGSSAMDRPLFFQYADNRAIRTPSWTLAEVDGGGWELFDAVMDPMEVVDVAASRPEMVDRLQARWMTWWRRVNASPDYRPNSTRQSPHYRPQGDRGTGAAYEPSAMPPK